MDRTKLFRRNAQLLEQLKGIKTAAAGRTLTRSQTADLDVIQAELSQNFAALSGTGITPASASHEDRIKAIEEAAAQPAGGFFLSMASTAKNFGLGDVDAGGVQILRAGQKMVDFVGGADAGPVSFDRFLRGKVSGRWNGATAEKALSEGTDSAGGFLVPDVLSAQVIDLMRNQARINQAGAVTIPMTSDNLRLARLAGDPTGSWKAELAAVADSNLTFERISLVPRVLAVKVLASVELIEDGHDVEGTISRSLAAALALELDRAALRGSGVGSEPTGLRNQTGVTVTSLGANGATPTYAKFSEAIQTVREGNDEPNAIIYSPRTAGTLDRLVDSTAQPLQPLPSFQALTKYTTKQIPDNLVHGTATNASEAYIGNFAQMYVGLRTSLKVEVSRTSGEAWDKLGLEIRAYLRADVALAHPGSFVVLTGIIP